MYQLGLDANREVAGHEPTRGHDMIPEPVKVSHFDLHINLAAEGSDNLLILIFSMINYA